MSKDAAQLSDWPRCANIESAAAATSWSSNRKQFHSNSNSSISFANNDKEPAIHHGIRCRVSSNSSIMHKSEQSKPAASDHKNSTAPLLQPAIQWQHSTHHTDPRSETDIGRTGKVWMMYNALTRHTLDWSLSSWLNNYKLNCTHLLQWTGNQSLDSFKRGRLINVSFYL